MKKSILILGGLIVLLIGTLAFANGGFEYTPGQFLQMKADACKLALASCTASDWYNYSIDDGSGAGKTLVVSPGDTVNLRGTVSVSGLTFYDPLFKSSITNGQYLESIDYFGTGQADLDGDGRYYAYDSGTGNISLSVPINSGSGTQIGSISAKIKSDVPDQTLITLRFYLDSGSLVLVGKSPSIAYADDMYGSTLRLLVSNPAPSTATATATQTPTTLPRTGAHN